MRITFDGRIPHPSYASIGMDGEHNAEIITLDGLPEHDGKTVVLNIILPNGTADALTVTDGQVTITRNTTLPGTATAWVSIHDGIDYVWKSEKIKLRVGELPDIDTPIDQQYPGIVDNVAAMADEAAAAASQAIEAAESVTGMTAQATTLDPWESATASYSNGVLSLGIPRGTQGVQGQKGDKGDKGDTGDKGPKGDKGDSGLPTGGATGQVLKKHSNTDGDVEWGSITESVTDVQLNGASVVTNGVANVQVTGVPSGGTAGQVLKKNSGNTGMEWGSVDALPSGGSTGQALVKNSNTNGDVKWATIIWIGTQAEYDAIVSAGTIDPNILYCIKEES